MPHVHKKPKATKEEFQETLANSNHTNRFFLTAEQSWDRCRWDMPIMILFSVQVHSSSIPIQTSSIHYGLGLCQTAISLRRLAAANLSRGRRRDGCILDHALVNESLIPNLSRCRKTVAKAHSNVQGRSLRGSQQIIAGYPYFLT